MRAEVKFTPARPAVALLIETSNCFGREVLQGIRAFMGEGRGWAVHLTESGRGNEPPPWLARWRGHGIIARIENEAIARGVRALKLPVVNVSAAGAGAEFPTVISDSQAIAGLAAEHLLERGFQHFAYCGDGRFSWSAVHGKNFAAYLDSRGHACSWFESAAQDFADWELERRKLGEWLAALPRPVGVMACYDIRGQQVLEVCRELGIYVPDEVAVIGQHNDELLCELCDPPLSSVMPNARRVGYEAAALLQRGMSGETLPLRTLLIEPVGVMTRQSTDVVAVHDSQVAAAVRYIRGHAREAITVSDVLRAVPMSRTILERRFKQLLGRTPYQQILRERLERVKTMLTTTDLTLEAIADRMGFEHPEYLSVAFKRQTGQSPSAYRVRHRT